MTASTQGGLPGLGVDLPVVDHFDPGEERLVELTQRRDVRDSQLGQEIGLDEFEEALDLTLACEAKPPSG